MWYDKVVIKILLLIAKILSRSGKTSYSHEIEKLEKEIFEERESE